MIYHFKIISHESKEFCMEMETDSESTFFSFHSAIQKNLGFESHQVASFFVSDNRGKKIREISMLGLGLNSAACHTMQKTRISEFIQSKGQQLIYTFDFFNDRSFYIELTGIIMGKHLNEPLITMQRGNAPAQILGEDSTDHDQVLVLQEEEVFLDFGELDDYTKIFGEMDDF